MVAEQQLPLVTVDVEGLPNSDLSILLLALGKKTHDVTTTGTLRGYPSNRYCCIPFPGRHFRWGISGIVLISGFWGYLWFIRVMNTVGSKIFVCL